MGKLSRLLIYGFCGIFLVSFVIGFFFFGVNLQVIELKSNNSAVYKYQEHQKNIEQALEKYKNKNLLFLSLTDVKKDIKEIYPAANFRIKRRIPNTLSIYFQKELVVAVILNNKSRFYPVSSEGEIFKALPQGKYLNLPVLRGQVFYDNKNLLKKVVKLLFQLPKENLFQTKNISEVVYDKSTKRIRIYLISGKFIVEPYLQLSLENIKNINFVLNYLIQKKHTGLRLQAYFKKKIIVNKFN